MGCYLIWTERDLERLAQSMGNAGAGRDRGKIQGAMKGAAPSSAEEMLETAAALSRHVPGAVGKYLDRWTSWSKPGLSDAAERVTGEFLQQHPEVIEQAGEDFKVTLHGGRHGVDVKLDGAKASVVVEVKVRSHSASPQSALGEGYGHRQMSDGWLQAVGIEDPSAVDVLMVQLNPEMETVSIYRRSNADASQWSLLMKKPWTAYGPLSK